MKLSEIDLSKFEINIELVEISKLKASEYNPRKISKHDYEELYKSIVKYGLVDPLIINVNPKRKNIVIGGHQRLKICKEIKFILNNRATEINFNIIV